MVYIFQAGYIPNYIKGTVECNKSWTKSLKNQIRTYVLTRWFSFTDSAVVIGGYCSWWHYFCFHEHCGDIHIRIVWSVTVSATCNTFLSAEYIPMQLEFISWVLILYILWATSFLNLYLEMISSFSISDDYDMQIGFWKRTLSLYYAYYYTHPALPQAGHKASVYLIPNYSLKAASVGRLATS